MTRCCCSEKFTPTIPKSGSEEAINFGLTLVSADCLSSVRRWSGGRMKVYAEVSLDGGAVKKSNVDVEGGINPTWNFTVDYPITESTLQSREVNLVVSLFCKRSVGRTLIGEVKICVKNLFDLGLRCENVKRYKVEGTLEGTLNISYSFRVPNPLCG